MDYSICLNYSKFLSGNSKIGVLDQQPDLIPVMKLLAGVKGSGEQDLELLRFYRHYAYTVAVASPNYIVDLYHKDESSQWINLMTATKHNISSIDPEKCFAIEDHPDGVLLARNAGCHVVGVRCRKTEPGQIRGVLGQAMKHCGAYLVVDRLQDVPKQLTHAISKQDPSYILKGFRPI